MSHETWIRFGSTFHGSWFSSTWPVRNLIGGQDAVQFVEQFVALTPGSGLQERFAVTSSHRQSAGEADSAQRNPGAAGTFQHELASQVMHKQMHPQFTLYRHGVFAAQMFHLQSGLEVAQGQFHLPPSKIESAQSGSRVLGRIHQGGDKNDFLGSKARYIHPASDQAQLQEFRQERPLFVCHIPRANPRLAPADQTFIPA